MDYAKTIPGKATDWTHDNPKFAVAALAGTSAVALIAILSLLGRKRKDNRRSARDRYEYRFVKRAVEESEDAGFESLEDALKDDEFYEILEALAEAESESHF